MSGFYGTVASRPLTTSDLLRLEQGANLLRHRGPDDEGYVLIHRQGAARQFRGSDSDAAVVGLQHLRHATPRGESIALAGRRLAIMDISPGGHIPMGDERGNWLVFNGEIYNQQELREQLVGMGSRFHSGGDTEVVLRAYAQWGSGCLERFDGAWAFALWDAGEQRLFCARDRFGEKPFYYASTGDGGFHFASVIAPLRRLVRPEINRPLVWDFLMHGLADHTPQTFFYGIEQLEPGHYLRLNHRRELQLVRFYDLRAKAVAVPACMTQAAEQLRTHLADSVRRCLRSHVPVTCLMNGDLGSTCVGVLADQYLASLNRHSPTQRLLTPVGGEAEGPSRNELTAGRNAANTLRRADAQLIRDSKLQLLRLVEMFRVQEQPFQDASALTVFLQLQQLQQRETVKVVLTGETGDQLLAGDQTRYLPLHLSRLLGSLRVQAWYQETLAWNWPMAVTSSLQGLFRKLPGPARRTLERFRNPVAELLPIDFLRCFAERDQIIHEQWRSLDLNQRLVADITRFHFPQRLRLLERNSMHWSLEARLPFLDHRLVEFVCSLREEWKMHAGYDKFILRKAMGGDLPQEILNRRDESPRAGAESFCWRACLPLLEEATGLEEFLDLAELKRRVNKAGAESQAAYWLPISLGLWIQSVFAGAGRPGIRSLQYEVATIEPSAHSRLPAAKDNAPVRRRLTGVRGRKPA